MEGKEGRAGREGRRGEVRRGAGAGVLSLCMDVVV